MHIIKSIIFWARRAVIRERKKLTKDNLWGFLNFIKRSEEENETKKLWSKSFEIKEDFFADVLAQRKFSAIINCIKLKFALVRQSGSEECALKTKAIFKIEIVIKKWLQKYTRNNFHPSLIDAILIIYLLFDFSLFLLYSEATCFMLWCTFFTASAIALYVAHEIYLQYTKGLLSTAVAVVVVVAASKCCWSTCTTGK